jgi:nitroreductase
MNNSLEAAALEAAALEAAALEGAARASMRAPSVFNTQPWHWRLIGDTLELRADRSRRLDTIDPDGRLLLLSCGAALHHARVTLAAAGRTAAVDRLPDEADRDLLARLTLVGKARRLAAAIDRRRTDRRAFGERPVPEDLLRGLRTAVEREGAYLHVVRRDQMPMLATSTARAADAELDDPAYRAELHRWTNRPPGSGDGVPAATAVQRAPRRVPVRDYAPDGTAGLQAGDGFDAGAAYVILFGAADEPADLVRGGEALSVLLLTATSEGLATAPLSDTIEVEWPRRLLRDLLAGVGEPFVVVRLGYRDTGDEVPSAPRRDPAEVIDVANSDRETGAES